MLFPCQDKRTGYDCTNVTCTNGTKTTTQVDDRRGDRHGLQRDLQRSRRRRGLRLRRRYAHLRDGVDFTNQNLFITGGTQETAGNGNDYNTYQLDVAPGATGAAKTPTT